MISIKEAFGFAAQHIKDLFESAYDIRLEEIEHVSPGLDSDIAVTVSFLIPVSSSAPDSGIGSLLSISAAQNRIFKIVVINRESGDFVGLKMVN
ncbi:hypothetical protein NVR49_21400 [Enterobacter roggenkampii]|uniref:hypothetical protein n=1 Tax=Enterobacter roggenkampii TaxID=1812935 RepID=UPI00254A4682|nr:hypothetical protein [Enterobacter roggenkampii]MDL0009142.1 hypothetical protein [Enterobacter roggenkampii]